MERRLAETEYLINELDQKERYQLVTRILPTLNRSQLEKITDLSEQLITDLILEKETSALFDIKEVNNNYYAYLKRLGKEYPNLYLGVMRFMKGKVYKLTHRVKETQKVIRGLGLEQEGLKTYLKIEFLLPEKAIHRYLFYDANLDLPRLPQKIDIERLGENLAEQDQGMVFSTLEQNFSDEKRYKRTVTPREEWSAIFIKKDWIVEEVKENVDTNSHLQSPVGEERLTQRAKEPRSSLPQKTQLPLSRPPENLYKKKSIQSEQKPKSNLTSIQVEKSFNIQVQQYLQQWVELSQLLPNNPQWQLTVEPHKLVLSDRRSNEVILEYERTTYRLSTRSARLLHSLLFEIVSNVANSKLITLKHQSSAQRWLLNLQNPPLENSKKLLAFIFDI